MNRVPMIAGNWKMNETNSEGVALAQGISFESKKEWDAVEVVLCPPFIDLKGVGGVLAYDHSKIALGAQNVHWEEKGAFTGEISPAMLEDAGCKYCIIGHSERRQMFGETDEGVNKKAKALLAHGILPIMCCGETAETRDAGNAVSFVTAQVRAGLEGLSADDVARMVIAYEPIWAIGTGRVPLPEDADEVCGAIRKTVRGLFGENVSDAIRILYGGSMKPGNAQEFLPMENIDGGLIGGAALKADTFAQLVDAAVAYANSESGR